MAAPSTFNCRLDDAARYQALTSELREHVVHIVRIEEVDYEPNEGPGAVTYRV